MSTEYWVSLPERAARAAAAGAGGLIHETAEVVLPQSVRRSRLYRTTIARALRITVELVGGVGGVFPDEALPVQELAARKLAGNAIELAGFLAVGWSPLWLLAAASDLSHGTRTYLRALEADLKRSGLLPETTDATSLLQLLTALEDTTGRAADSPSCCMVPSARR